MPSSRLTYRPLVVALALLGVISSAQAQFELKVAVPDLRVSSAITPEQPTDTLVPSSSALEFGNKLVGQTNGLTLVWTNPGEEPVSWGQAAVSGNGFSMENVACPNPLPAKESCSIGVRFTPAEAFRYSGQFVWRAGGQALAIPLGGTGVTDPAAAVNWTVGDATYGDREVVLTPPQTGLPGAWAFASSDPSLVSVEGSLALVKGAGTVTLTATQEASGGQPARSYSALMVVKKATPELGSWSPLTVGVGAYLTLEPPSSTSSASWKYSVANTQLATVDLGQLHGRAQGSTTLLAEQLESPNYRSARLNVTLTVLPKAALSLQLGGGLSTRQGETKTVGAVLTNNDSQEVTLGSNALGVSSAGSLFSVTGNQCKNTTLAPGNTCSFTLRLSGSTNSGAPAAPGSKTGSVWVTSATQAASLPVSGTVTARDYILMSGGASGPSYESQAQHCHQRYAAQFGGPETQYFCNTGAWFSVLSQSSGCDRCAKYVDKVSLSTRQINFGDALVGSENFRSVLLQNDESFAVAVSNVSVTGSNTFSASSSCQELAPGQNCVATLRWQPTIGGSSSGTLRFATNSEGSPYLVALSGRATYLNAERGTLSLSAKTFGDAAFTLVPPSSSSPGAWSFSSSNDSVASVSGNTVTLHRAGSVTLTATQAASGAYASGSVSATLTINKAPAVAQAWPDITVAYRDTPYALTAPSSTGDGTWSFALAETGLGTVTGSQFQPTAVGSSTITATQSAGANYLGTSQTATLTVVKGEPTIQTWSVPKRYLSDGSFALSAPSSNSMGSWTYSSSNPAVATVSGNTVTPKTTGTTTLTATQAASALYNGGQVSAEFTVTAHAAQTCLALLTAQPGLPSGVYTLYPNGSAQSVYCDMTTAGGGWTLIGRFTNWGGAILTNKQAMVRGQSLPGYSNSSASFPAYSGPNVFQALRFDSANASWNSRFGVTASAGVLIPTWSTWPTVTSPNHLVVKATRLDGSTSSALSTMALSAAAWWNTSNPAAVSGSGAFSLFTTPSNAGDCGGENRIGYNMMCPTWYPVVTNNHYDITSLKWLYAR